MSYVNKNLMPGENVVMMGKIHWAIYLRPLVILIIGIAFCYSGRSKGLEFMYVVGSIFIFFALLGLIRKHLIANSCEYAITNKRLILKMGILRKRTIEIFLGKIESLEVSQGIFGGILGYGSLRTSGTGGTHENFPFCSDPNGFKKCLYVQVESANKPAAVAAPVTPIVTAVADSDSKKCPACAETIKAAAKKCRYCGETLAA